MRKAAEWAVIGAVALALGGCAASTASVGDAVEPRLAIADPSCRADPAGRGSHTASATYDPYKTVGRRARCTDASADMAVVSGFADIPTPSIGGGGR